MHLFLRWHLVLAIIVSLTSAGPGGIAVDDIPQGLPDDAGAYVKVNYESDRDKRGQAFYHVEAIVSPHSQRPLKVKFSLSTTSRDTWLFAPKRQDTHLPAIDDFRSLGPLGSSQSPGPMKRDPNRVYYERSYDKSLQIPSRPFENMKYCTNRYDGAYDDRRADEAIFSGKIIQDDILLHDSRDPSKRIEAKTVDVHAVENAFPFGPWSLYPYDGSLGLGKRIRSSRVEGIPHKKFTDTIQHVDIAFKHENQGRVFFDYNSENHRRDGDGFTYIENNLDSWKFDALIGVKPRTPWKKTRWIGPLSISLALEDRLTILPRNIIEELLSSSSFRLLLRDGSYAYSCTKSPRDLVIDVQGKPFTIPGKNWVTRRAAVSRGRDTFCKTVLKEDPTGSSIASFGISFAEVIDIRLIFAAPGIMGLRQEV